MRTIHRRIVGALLLSADNCILLGHKGFGPGAYNDCWVLPGGGVQDGETDLEALRREVLEETGIDIRGLKITLIEDELTGETVKIDKRTGEQFLCKMRFFDYRVLVPRPAQAMPVTAHDDIDRAAWVDIDSLGTYRLSPSLEDLLRKHQLLK